MLVQEIMNTDVKTISKEDSIKKASQVMVENNIGSLIVIENSRMVGIITEGDILRAAATETDLSKVLVKSTMTTKVIFVKPTDTVEDVAELMSKKKIKKLPVIAGSALVGIVTASDVVASEPKFMELIGHLMSFRKRQFAAG